MADEERRTSYRHNRHKALTAEGRAILVQLRAALAQVEARLAHSEALSKRELFDLHVERDRLKFLITPPEGRGTREWPSLE